MQQMRTMLLMGFTDAMRASIANFSLDNLLIILEHTNIKIQVLLFRLSVYICTNKMTDTEPELWLDVTKIANKHLYLEKDDSPEWAERPQEAQNFEEDQTVHF